MKDDVLKFKWDVIPEDTCDYDCEVCTEKCEENHGLLEEE